MARRSLREYPQLNGNAGDMIDKEEIEELSNFRGSRKSPTIGTPLKRSPGLEVDHIPKRRKSPRAVSPFRNSPGKEWDHLDGQHIEENLGFDEKEFPSSIFSDYGQVIAVLLVVLVAAVIGYAFVIRKNASSDLSSETEASILEILKPLTKKFISQQKNIWFQIFTGFTNLIRPPVSPAVYLLLSDEKSKRTSSCIAEIITSVANKILPNNKKWLFLNGTELSEAKSRDAGILVESVAENMGFSRVLVVSDIQKIPGHLAAGFHFLVDQENPKIRDAVYVFTMTIDQIGGRVKPLDAVEKTLSKSWSDLSENILHPLVTRVTEAVLHIVQEEEIGACPLKTDSTLEIKIP